MLGAEIPEISMYSLKSWKPRCSIFDKRLTFSQKYILGFLDFSYFSCFVPFRLTFDLQDNKLIVKRRKNPIQQLICASVHIIVLGISGKILYDEFLMSSSRSSFLDVTISVTSCIIVGYFTYTVWMRSESFQWIFESDPEEQSFLPIRDKVPIRETLQNVTALLCPTLSTVVGILYANWFQTTKGHIRWEDGWTISNFIAISTSCLILVGHFLDVIFQVIALTYRDRAHAFLEMVASEAVSLEKVLKGFINLKAYVNGINQRFGTWIICSAILTIPFYSLRFAELFKGQPEPIVIIVVNLGYFTWIFFSLILTAHVSWKISDSLKSWLAKDGNFSKLTNQQLIMLMSEITTESIGLKGGNYFVLSYRFVGTVLSLIITYAFIEQHSTPK